MQCTAHAKKGKEKLQQLEQQQQDATARDPPPFPPLHSLFTEVSPASFGSGGSGFAKLRFSGLKRFTFPVAPQGALPIFRHANPKH